MDMKKHLPSADLEKLGKILEIKEAYQRGDISLEEGRTRIREQIGKIRPYEIALAEQELKTIEENECRKEDIQKMIDSMKDGDTLSFEKNGIYENICIYVDKNIKILGNNATLIGYETKGVNNSNIPLKVWKKTIYSIPIMQLYLI